jgi:hypothetical protein
LEEFSSSWVVPRFFSSLHICRGVFIFINTADSDVVKYLKIFTFLSHEEIEQLERAVQEEPHLSKAQKEKANLKTSIKAVDFITGIALFLAFL